MKDFVERIFKHFQNISQIYTTGTLAPSSLGISLSKHDGHMTL